MTNKKFFYLIIIIFFAILIYILSGIYGLIDYKKYKIHLFENSIDLNFHYKYSNRINHLRERKKDGKTTDYLFNNIGNIKSQNKVLFLGDSWFQQINKNDHNSSYKSLEEFSMKNNFEITNAGITSFSPSLMQLQYGILKNEFNIDPSILIIHIEQTDIGDEYCRYRKIKKYDHQNSLVSIKRFDYDKEIFNGLKIYRYTEIKLNNKNLGKFFKLSNFTIEYFFKKNFFRIGKIIENGWMTDKQLNYYKCRFEVIQSFLENENKDANEYFKKTLVEFFNYLNSQTRVKKIIITSFPHKKHLQNNYKTNVSNLIDDVLADYSSKFEHLNFSNSSYENFNLDKLYQTNDIASHLRPKYHNEIFIKKIIEKLN